MSHNPAKVIAKEHCVETVAVGPAPSPLDGPAAEHELDALFHDDVAVDAIDVKASKQPAAAHDDRLGKLHPADRDNLRSMFPEHADKFE
jgi:hypothetical protein